MLTCSGCVCLVTKCQYKPLCWCVCVCVYRGRGGGDMCPNTMLTCSGCACMQFVFGHRVSIQTAWLGGVWHAHQHHDPHPQAQVGRPGTLSTDQTAHTQVPQTLVFCAISHFVNRPNSSHASAANVSILCHFSLCQQTKQLTRKCRKR